LYNPVNGKVVVNKNVVFDEGSYWNWDEKKEAKTGEKGSGAVTGCDEIGDAWKRSESSEEQEMLNREEVAETPMRTYVRRGRDVRESNRKTKLLSDLYESTQVMLVADPTSFEEATVKEEWNEAMKEEITAIERIKTWNLVRLPEGKNAIGVKWLYKTKVGSEGEIVKYKARLVVRAFT
jgi:Reverse transcriptase (RNA-dependent DNA polymerase)